MAAADDDDEDDDSTPGDETAVDLGADVLSQAVLGPCVDGIGCTVTAVIDAALPLCVGDVLQTLAGDDVSKQDFPIILQQLKEGPKPLASTWRRRGDEAPDGDEATDGGDPSPTVAEGGMSVKLLAAMPSLASAALAIPKGVSLRNMGAISGRTLDYGRAAVTSARKSYDAQRGRSLEPNFASSLAADSPQTPDADDAATDSGAAASAPPDAPSRRRGDAAVPAAGDAAAAQQQAHSFAEQRCVDLERSLVAARNKLATTESKLSVRENKLEQAAATRQKLEAKLATARAGLDEAAAAGDAQRVVAAADAALVLGAARAEADQIRADAEQQTSKLRADTDAAAATHRAALGEAQWQLQDTQDQLSEACADLEVSRRKNDDELDRLRSEHEALVPKALALQRTLDSMKTELVRSSKEADKARRAQAAEAKLAAALDAAHELRKAADSARDDWRELAGSTKAIESLQTQSAKENELRRLVANITFLLKEKDMQLDAANETAQILRRNAAASEAAQGLRRTGGPLVKEQPRPKSPS